MLFIQVIFQKPPPMFGKENVLLFKLFGGLVRDILSSPNLAVRMWIGTAHHRAFVFKNLHILNKILRAELHSLVCPCADNVFDGALIELGQSQIMTRGETNDTANSPLVNGDKQRVINGMGGIFGRQQRGKVVVENKCGGIVGVSGSSCSFISWTKITVRVIWRLVFRWCLFYLAVPRTV